VTMISDMLARCTGFEWDKYNSEKVKARHGVTSVECEQVFFNLPVIAGDDEKHSETENRFYVLGQTDSGRLLFLAFTVRKNKLRVISARDMNKKERRVYQTHEEENSPIQE
jgi:uncharacterized DUF497 family protein